MFIIFQVTTIKTIVFFFTFTCNYFSQLVLCLNFIVDDGEFMLFQEQLRTFLKIALHLHRITLRTIVVSNGKRPQISLNEYSYVVKRYIVKFALLFFQQIGVKQQRSKVT